MLLARGNSTTLLSILLLGGLFIFLLIIGAGQRAHAADTSQFDASYIISDPVFTDYKSMTASQIQAFLESKNSVCLVNFQTQSLNDMNGDGLGDEPYGKGINELVSASTLIWQAAQLYQINPQVILTTLQKEQGLITRTDCPEWRYNTALGYGCPDSAPCNTSAYGFTRQIDYGVWHFRGFFDDGYPIPPITPGDRYIAYNPSSSCGGTTLHIQNRATAALYSYTPYQPNSATLAAPMGQTVNCGAYGNINFWRYFTDWFGSTVNPRLNYFLIKTSSSSAVYLQTPEAKHYILSGEIIQNWGLENLSIQTVSQSYLDSIPNGANLGELLKDDWENYFVVEDGKLHYVRDSNYLNLWGLNKSDAAQSLGLVRSLDASTWLGRFIQLEGQPSSSYWLIDNGKRHLISDPSMLYQWRYTADQLTTVSAGFLDSIPIDNNDISARANNGTSEYIIDSGRKLSLNNQTRSAYSGSSTSVLFSNVTLSFLPEETATPFVLEASTGHWYMLEGGKKHYIMSGWLAEIWGKSSSSPPTKLSDSFMSSLTDDGNLTYIVQTTNPTAYWLIDKSKRYIPDSTVATAWLGENVTPPVYTVESLSSLQQSADATNVIKSPNSNYAYVLNEGSRHYLSTIYANQAWGIPTTQTSSQIVNIIPEGVFVTQTVLDINNNAYLLAGTKKYAIDQNFQSTWGVTNNTLKVNNLLLARYQTSSTLKAFIKIGATSYVMTHDGVKIPISKYLDTYNTSTLGETVIDIDYFPTGLDATYLIKSNESGSGQLWFVNGGKKMTLTFAQQVTMGYLSRGVQATSLDPSTIALFPDDQTVFSPLIQRSGSGVKLTNFGTALGFPDGTTLTNYISSNGVMMVSNSVFDSIPLVGSTSRVITDDAGKYYLMQDGQRKWLTNSSAYAPYVSIPRVYLYGTTLSSITEGTAITN
ncbi:MAG: hypothetical protein WA030_00425 [Candidatus Microsaccharimonas sp.]